MSAIAFFCAFPQKDKTYHNKSNGRFALNLESTQVYFLGAIGVAPPPLLICLSQGVPGGVLFHAKAPHAMDDSWRVCAPPFLSSTPPQVSRMKGGEIGFMTFKTVPTPSMACGTCVIVFGEKNACKGRERCDGTMVS